MSAYFSKNFSRCSLDSKKKKKTSQRRPKAPQCICGDKQKKNRIEPKESLARLSLCRHIQLDKKSLFKTKVTKHSSFQVFKCSAPPTPSPHLSPNHSNPTPLCVAPMKSSPCDSDYAACTQMASLVLCVHSVASFLPLISTSSMSEGIQANTAIEDFPNCQRKCFSVFESKYVSTDPAVNSD